MVTVMEIERFIEGHGDGDEDGDGDGEMSWW